MYDIIVLVACCLVGHSITKQWVPSIIVALIITAFYSHFRQINTSVAVKATTVERFSTTRPKKSKGGGKGKRTMKKYLKGRRFKKGAYNFDPEASLQETYKSLSSKQSAGLNKDTKDLIKTQQQLMGTLKEMGPVLEQGKTIISTFDSFFKDGGTKNQDLDYMRKRLGIGDVSEKSTGKASDAGEGKGK
jgi:hypothetical protein